jgi:hypothetical protein
MHEDNVRSMWSYFGVKLRVHVLSTFASIENKAHVIGVGVCVCDYFRVLGMGGAVWRFGSIHGNQLERINHFEGV